MGRVVRVERVPYEGWAYSIEVAEDESYVANNIVVHNCQKGVNQDAKYAILSKMAVCKDGRCPVRLPTENITLRAIRTAVRKAEADYPDAEDPGAAGEVEKHPGHDDQSVHGGKDGGQTDIAEDRESWLASLPAEVREVFEGDSTTHSNLEAMARLQVNADLLGVKGPLNSYPEYRGMVKQVGKALELATTGYAASLSQDVSVFRGVDKGKPSAGAREGYLFVTTDPKMAAQYAGKRGVVQESVLPAGSSVAYGWSDQSELILPQGTELSWDDDGLVDKYLNEPEETGKVEKHPGHDDQGVHAGDGGEKSRLGEWAGMAEHVQHWKRPTPTDMKHDLTVVTSDGRYGNLKRVGVSDAEVEMASIFSPAKEMIPLDDLRVIPGNRYAELREKVMAIPEYRKVEKQEAPSPPSSETSPSGPNSGAGAWREGEMSGGNEGADVQERAGGAVSASYDEGEDEHHRATNFLWQHGRSYLGNEDLSLQARMKLADGEVTLTLSTGRSESTGRYSADSVNEAVTRALDHVSKGAWRNSSSHPELKSGSGGHTEEHGHRRGDIVLPDALKEKPGVQDGPPAMHMTTSGESKQSPLSSPGSIGGGYRQDIGAQSGPGPKTRSRSGVVSDPNFTELQAATQGTPGLIQAERGSETTQTSSGAQGGKKSVDIPRCAHGCIVGYLTEDQLKQSEDGDQTVEGYDPNDDHGHTPEDEQYYLNKHQSAKDHQHVAGFPWWEEGVQKNRPKDQCMGCGMRPTKEVLHAEGRARAWFCDECFAKFAAENTGDIVSVKRITDGIVKGNQSFGSDIPGGSETDDGSEEKALTAVPEPQVHTEDFNIAKVWAKSSKPISKSCALCSATSVLGKALDSLDWRGSVSSDVRLMGRFALSALNRGDMTHVDGRWFVLAERDNGIIRRGLAVEMGTLVSMVGKHAMDIGKTDLWSLALASRVRLDGLHPLMKAGDGYAGLENIVVRLYSLGGEKGGGVAGAVESLLGLMADYQVRSGSLEKGFGFGWYANAQRTLARAARTLRTYSEAEMPEGSKTALDAILNDIELLENQLGVTREMEKTGPTLHSEATDTELEIVQEVAKETEGNVAEADDKLAAIGARDPEPSMSGEPANALNDPAQQMAPDNVAVKVGAPDYTAKFVGG